MAQGEQCLKKLAHLVNIQTSICYRELLWHTEKYDASYYWLQLALDRLTAVQADIGVDVQRAHTLLNKKSPNTKERKKI